MYYVLPKWNQENINNLNRSIMSNEIKRVIKKSPEQDDSLLNYVSPLKEDLTSVLLKLFHK
jgi:hypothetical protein